MTVLKGANTTAQWYLDEYPGGHFSKLEKFLIHTTETRGWPGYNGGAHAPNATYDPRRREIRQHFPNERSARSLRDPSGTAVRENRDDVFQLEIICYSDYSLARDVGGLWVGDLEEYNYKDLADMIWQLHDEMDLPVQSSVRWKEGEKTFVSGVRLSGSQYDRYSGILGHMHASGNTHWDPGGFRYSRLERQLNQKGGFMAIDRDDVYRIAHTDGVFSAPIHNPNKKDNPHWQLDSLLKYISDFVMYRGVERVVTKPYYPDEKIHVWNAIRYNHSRLRKMEDVLDLVAEQVKAILDSQMGADSESIKQLINQRHDEAKSEREIITTQLVSVIDLAQSWIDGDTTGDDVVRRIVELLNVGLETVDNVPEA